MARWNQGFGWALVVFGGVMLSAGCGSGSGNAKTNTNGSSDAGAGGSSPYASEPSLGELKQGWNEIAPGGPTMCARGQPWEFFVRPGKVNKVVVEFQGGGACWNYAICLPGANLFRDHLVIPPAMSDESLGRGLLDHADPRNPFRDWTHVFVPYCTGDLHWGDVDHEYKIGTNAYTVHHRGADNVEAVLDWMKRNVKGPTEILSTGSSAGSYGSIMWAPHLAKMYPDAKVTQMGDAGAGVLTPDVVPQLKAEWNVAASFPDFIPGADLTKINTLGDIYTLVGKGYPEMQLAQYNTDYDWNQLYWFGLMGGSKDPTVWSADMKKNLADIAAAVPSFRSYTAPGWRHTVDSSPQFYTMQSGGVKLVDWMSALLDRKAQSVDCGQHCGGPEIMSGSSGWECIENPTADPVPVDADLELPLRLLHDEPPTWGSFSGLSVSACGALDPNCVLPLAKATTDSDGQLTLHVPGLTDGFAGYLSMKGPKTSERLIIRPAIRDPQHPVISDRYEWGIASTTDLAQQAKDLGIAYDPSNGVVAVEVYDCNLSLRKDVTVELDGAAPVAFNGPPSWVPSQTPNVDSIWFNVAPGKHTVTATFPGASAPTSETIDVDAGGLTVLSGLSPQTVEPM